MTHLNRGKLYISILTAFLVFQVNAQVALEDTASKLEGGAETNSISKLQNQSSTEAPAIATSKPYQLHRLFTVPTAYALRPFGLRFGGEGNIHSTLAHLSTAGMHATVAAGLGGVAELGYQLDEYYTVGNNSDIIMMGHFKMRIIKESAFIPAVAISAGQNLKETFMTKQGRDYKMTRNAFDLVVSKSIAVGNYYFSIHPGVQYFQDKLTSYDGQDLTEGQNPEDRKINYRLGFSWQTQPQIVFMFESKYLTTSNITELEIRGLSHHQALENNLGVRYYIRNWLCMDAGIRHLYNLDTDEDDMKLHANFVGVIPLDKVYTRIENMFKD